MIVCSATWVLTAICHRLSALQVPRYEKPRHHVRHWLQYTGGAVGITVASLWLIKHSRLGGSDDLDTWLNTAREDASLFMEKRVHQPVQFLLELKVPLCR